MWKRIFNKLAVMQEKRAAYWMLQNMNDQQLKDIGVSRSDISRQVYS